MRSTNHFTEGAISTSCIADLLAKQCGAHNLFLGQVRDEGGTVFSIEYSAYQEMAEEALQKLVDEALATFEITTVTIRHSLGSVLAGEICLLVYVSALHRDAAFVACRHVVERIKAEIPIFGKEILADKQQWKVNR